MAKIHERLVIVLILGVAICLGFFAAHVFKKYSDPIFASLNETGEVAADHWIDAVDELVGSDTDSRDSTDIRLSTVFTTIEGTVINLPLPEREGEGGAVTTADGYLVVINHEGKIYFVDRHHNVTLSAIEVPDNGLDSYERVASESPFNEWPPFFYTYRFNDISYFNSNGQKGLVLSYTIFDEERRCYGTALARLDIDLDTGNIALYKASSANWINLYQTRPCIPLTEDWGAIKGYLAGGRIAYDGRRTIYLSSGDYGWNGIEGPRNLPENAPQGGLSAPQDPATDLGKIMAVDLFSGAAHQVSRGHRNPQGIALDNQGELWIVDHGLRGGDELNYIVEGENYGWPLESYGTYYSPLSRPDAHELGSHDTYRRPVMAWLPSIAVSGLSLIKGFHRNWDGDLLISTLRNRSLYRARIVEGRAVFAERIWIGTRIRYVHQHNDGRIVLWTDSQQLIFLKPVSDSVGFDYVSYRLETSDTDKSTFRQLRTALQFCTDCHSFDPSDNQVAPSLAEVYGAQIASRPFTGYSDAFLGESRSWTKDLLLQFLANPQATIPGTLMPNTYISDEKVLHELVSILEGLAKGGEIPSDYREN